MRRAALRLLLACGMASCSGDQARSGLPLSLSDSAVVFPAMGIRIEVGPLDPLRAVRAEGRSHLFYELRLTSFDPRVFRVDSVDVVSSATAEHLLRLSGQRLSEAAQALGAGDPLLLESGTSSFLFFGFPFEEADFAPGQLQHRLWLSHNDSSGEHGHLLTTAPERNDLDERVPLHTQQIMQGGHGVSGGRRRVPVG